MSFHQFLSFPPEIQNLVLESCPPNDQICLRLTCKTLYSALPSTKSKIPLDQLEIPGPLCGETGITGFHAGCYHKKSCHSLTYTAIKAHNDSMGKVTRAMSSRCRTGWRSNHCECFTQHQKLYNRLRAWMPKGMGYCGVCEMFTPRKRGHNGRCYHGRPKPRKSSGGHYWTHTSRNGAFGRKIWKKWFNNRSWNRMEKRLRGVGEDQLEIVRRGTQRYDMRKLKGKDVDTQVERDSKSRFW